MRAVKREQFKRVMAIVDNPRVESVDCDWKMEDTIYLTVALEFDSISDTEAWERIFGWTPNEMVKSLALAVVYQRKQPATLWERYMKVVEKYQKWLTEYLPTA